LLTVEDPEETLRTHLPVSSSVRRARMLQALADVGIRDPARVARLYPHVRNAARAS